MSMNTCLMIGKQAGVIGFLTTLASKNTISAVVAYDNDTEMMAKQWEIPTFKTINDKEFLDYLKKSDILISIHGREIVSKEIIKIPKYGCINVHPCLYKYKGKEPVKKMLEDGVTKASVGIHWMTEKIDSGDIIIEEFVDVNGLKNEIEIYNMLYPYYSSILFKALELIQKKV